MFRLLPLLLVVLTQQPISKPETLKILFVGNSLTYTNNLPELVEKLGEKSNININIKTQMLAKPNYALEDHWNEGELQRVIKSGKFDFVVVQQGPSSQAEGRAMLFDSGEKIQALCKQHNSKLAFFMVWPARANYKTFDGVIQNHTEAATKTNAVLCPVGKIWKEHFDATNDFSYYGPDQFHPSMAGSQVAAAVIYKTLITK
jgi:hypothetical protein